MVDTQSPPRALITDFGFPTVAYSKPYAGYVGSNNVTPWDFINDVYAFGVTCCQVCSHSAAVSGMFLGLLNTVQVVLVNRRLRIASVPGDINACLSQLDPNEEDSKELRQQFVQKLRHKFFPLKKSPPPFFQDIFDLVANTCCFPTCKMDYVVNLLDDAARRHAVMPPSSISSSYSY